MVLREMGFDKKWIGWIQWCISTSSFYVIINGSSACFFKSSRSLHQGDSLSPYLFVLRMKVFSLLIDMAKMGGFLSGYDIRGRNCAVMNISHLLFSNDTLSLQRVLNRAKFLLNSCKTKNMFMAKTNIKVRTKKC